MNNIVICKQILMQKYKIESGRFDCEQTLIETIGVNMTYGFTHFTPNDYYAILNTWRNSGYCNRVISEIKSDKKRLGFDSPLYQLLKNFG